VPRKSCLVTGCCLMALPGNSRCEEHKLKSWSRRPIRPDLDSAWSRLSHRRRKAFPICEVPGCSRPSTSTDHIVPYSEGGTSAWENLQALCGPHHQEKTVAESHRASKRKAAARRLRARGS
jgi:5-methylcytosine-specific restriction endonuclease McrA